MKNIMIEGTEAACYGNVLTVLEEIVTKTTPMVAETEREVLKIIRGEVKLGEKDDDREALWAYATACQSLGFQNGFKLAVRMMAECMMD